MSIIAELYDTKLELYEKEKELYEKEKELAELNEEYNNYRKIVESNSDNIKVRRIKEHISWCSRDDLKKEAKEVSEQEWLDNYVEKARRDERRRRRDERRRRAREERRERVAERKALEELMEKEKKLN